MFRTVEELIKEVEKRLNVKFTRSEAWNGVAYKLGDAEVTDVIKPYVYDEMYVYKIVLERFTTDHRVEAIISVYGESLSVIVKAWKKIIGRTTEFKNGKIKNAWDHN